MKKDYYITIAYIMELHNGIERVALPSSSNVFVCTLIFYLTHPRSPESIKEGSHLIAVVANPTSFYK